MIDLIELRIKIEEFVKFPVDEDTNLLDGALDSFALVNLLNYLELKSKENQFKINFDSLITSGRLSMNLISKHIEEENK
jgi:aryl carrier-like protein